jgi:poly(3-hydroxybutyrate) depolymerase
VPRRHRRIALLVTLATLAAAAGIVVAVRPERADPQGAHVARYAINSRLVGRELDQRLVEPPAGVRPGTGLVVLLHGRGGDQDSSLVDDFYGALHRLGPRAPAVLFPAGGDHSYWHDRGDGRWGAYVLREAIPEALRRLGGRGRPVAIGGISMGGFGALDLARLHPGRFCAAAGHAPAIWVAGGETADGAFDDAEDFARHDLVATARANPGAWRGTRLWLDAGDRDDFRAGDDAFLAALRAGGRAGGTSISAHIWPGRHTSAYWDGHWPSYLRFYARALAAC